MAGALPGLLGSARDRGAPSTTAVAFLKFQMRKVRMYKVREALVLPMWTFLAEMPAARHGSNGTATKGEIIHQAGAPGMR